MQFMYTSRNLGFGNRRCFETPGIQKNLLFHSPREWTNGNTWDLESRKQNLVGKLGSFLSKYIFLVFYLWKILSRHWNNTFSHYCSLLIYTLLQHFLRILPQKLHRKLRNTPFNWMWKEAHALLLIPWPGTYHRHKTWNKRKLNK